MRIAFDVGPLRAEPTGVGVFASAMAAALVAALPAGDVAFIGRRDGVTLPPGVPAAPMGHRGYVPWVQLRAAEEARALRADIVHFSDGVVPIRQHSRTVVSIHDMSVVRTWRMHPVRRWSRIPFVLLSPRLADVVLVPSRATADEVVALTGTRARKIEVMPYAPQQRIEPASRDEVNRVLANHGLSNAGFILSLGTIEPRKNHLRLIEAFEMLVRERRVPDDLQLVIAGHEGWRAGAIVQRITSSPASARMQRLGYVSHEDLPALLTGAAVVAYPSLYEGFGLPVVEAMACGAATVTSNVSSMPEVAGDAAFLVDPYQVADIARGVVEALDASGGDREGTSRRAIQQASTFTWARAAEIAVETYRTRFGS